MRQGDQQNHSLLIEDAGRVSLLSHDIRSTYAELQSALNTLEHAFDLPAEAKMELHRVAHTGAHLGRLLDLASGVIFPEHLHRPLPAAISNPRAALTGLVHRWKRITERLGSTLQLDGLDHMPERADLDMLALERVLSNLVSNALNHADPGPISISIFRQGWPPSQQLVFRIRDAGPGFPEQALTPDGAKDIPIGVGEPGSGFGLRVARDAAKSLNGTLMLQNPPDGGAEARLTIPLISERSHEDLRQAPPRPLPAGFSALVVEDSAALRLKLRHELEALGLLVIEAADGPEALDILSSADAARIDVVFLDIELPLLSGLQMLSTLQHRGVTPPPVIAITAHVFAANLQAFANCGITSVLRKPVASRREIRRLLVEALKDLLPDEAILPESSPPENRERCEIEALAQRLPPQTARKVLTQLSVDLGQYLNNAQKAAQSSLSECDRETMSRAMHALSSLFGLACVPEAQDQAHHLSKNAQHIAASEIIAILQQLRQYASNIQTKILSILDSELSTNVSEPNSDR